MVMRRAAARCGEWAQHFQMLLVDKLIIAVPAELNNYAPATTVGD